MSLRDKNSGYFHASTKIKRTINKILVIETEEDVPLYEEDQILGVITSYFNLLFSTQPGEKERTVSEAIDKSVSEEENMKLIRDPTSREIKNATFSIHADKAHGPDGFSVGFFQSNWRIVGLDIVKEVQEFFKTSNIPSSLILPTSG